MEGPDETAGAGEIGEGSINVSRDLGQYQSNVKRNTMFGPGRSSLTQRAHSPVDERQPSSQITAEDEGDVDILIALRGLGNRFESVDASQIELKELMTELNAKFDDVVTSLGSSPASASSGPGLSAKQARRFVGGRHLNGTGTADMSAFHLGNRGSSTPLDDGLRSGGLNPKVGSIPLGLYDEPERNASGSGSFELGSRSTMVESKGSMADALEPLRIRNCFEEYSQSRMNRKRSARQGQRYSSLPAHDQQEIVISRFKAWSPESHSRKILDFLGILIVGYDAFLLPYWLAWQSDTQANLGIWTTCIFWTLYLPVQLVTGFRDRDARLVLDPWRSALNYLKTWFALDLTVVICDWLSILITEPRLFRYLRIMRLVRGGRVVLRFVALVQAYKLSSQFLEVHLSMDISLLLVFILWVNHVVSCGWYVVGKYAYTDTGLTWLMDPAFSAGHGSWYEYSTSLHWALTQMTPASMEVVPECTAERAYNLVTIIFSMLVFSSFGATLTSSLTQYRLNKERTISNFMQLQRYLLQQGVEPELGMAIKLQVKNQLRKRQRLHWKNVAYLDYASKTLKEALWHSCCMKCIRQHAFLHALNLHDPSAINALCNSAIVTVEYSQGDIVFEVGGDAKEGCMHFLVCGRMFYDPGPAAAEAGRIHGDPLLTLGEGAFVSEVALWTLWKHLGTLFVEAPTEVLRLKGEGLVEALLRRFPETMHIVAHYCVAFHASLHELGCVRSDLAHTIDSHDLMSALDSNIRMELAKPILDKLRSRGGRFAASSKSLDMLDAELQSGKCNIGIEDDEPVRTVSVVAVKLSRSECQERFLVKVGEFMRNGDVKASCVLPGRKRVAKESGRGAIERTLETDLAEIKDDITVLPGSDKYIFMKDSASYGVRTRYLRVTYHAVLSDESRPPYLNPSWPNGIDSQEAAHHIRSSESIELEAMNYRNSGIVQVLSWCKRHTHGAQAQRPPQSSVKSSGKQRALKILAGMENVMLLPCEEESKAKNTINVWLTQEEFNVLSHDNATPTIKEWLTSIQRHSESICTSRGSIRESIQSTTGVSLTSMSRQSSLTRGLAHVASLMSRQSSMRRQSSSQSDPAATGQAAPRGMRVSRTCLEEVGVHSGAALDI